VRTKILVAGAVVASAGLGVVAASGFGDGGGQPAKVSASDVAAHRVDGPPPGSGAPVRRASLFKVIYKATRPNDVDPGVNVVTVRSCPRGGAVLSGWFIRNGADKSGLEAGGGAPVRVRRWQLVVNNTTGAVRRARFGIVCIK
jgi:hypothetical protein